MDFLDFTAGEDDAGRRIDRIARRLMPGRSLGMIYKCLRKGLVRKNGFRAGPETRVEAGDVVSVASFLLACGEPSPSRQDPPGPGDCLGQDLFANRHIRIVNKPYGIPVQGGRDIPLSLDRIVAREYLQAQRRKGTQPSLSFRPGPLHRLDRKTTGALAFSQSLLGAQWFSQALKDHSIGKEYLALVEGRLARRQRWQEAIARTARAGAGGFVRSEISGGGQGAATTARPLAWGSFGGRPVTLLHLEISTGRTHQIRLHCSHHGFPLLGDTAYGGRPIAQTGAGPRMPKGQDGGGQDLFLHAWRLTVPACNPLDLPPLVEAPLPENFRDMLLAHLPETELTGYSVQAHEIF